MKLPKWMRGSGDLIWMSAGGSDAGRVRELNEDSFLDMPSRQLWVVADGMGGHASGDVASSEVIAAISAVGLAENLNAISGLVATAVLGVNDQLRSMARERGSQVVIGSTFVAAVARGDKMAILWAGDSRAYRLRGNRFEQLTRDHDLLTDMQRQNASEELIAAVGNSSNVVSRAVGAHDKLKLEEIRASVQPGDTYLLCSDGLYKELSDEQIGHLLREGGAGRGAARLIDMAVRAGGRDNVTVIVMTVSD